MFNIIVAYSVPGNGIGYRGDLPWSRLKADMMYFRKLTTGHVVIMGRKTFESMQSTPLPGRRNIVVSNTLSPIVDVEVTSSLDSALQLAKSSCTDVFVIGGERMYEEALRRSDLGTIYATELFGNYRHDTCFPKVDTISLFRGDILTEEDTRYRFTTQILHHKISPEKQYQDLMQRILTDAHPKIDRTGIGTLSLFGERIEFNLRQNTLPLLTTKRVFWRGVVEELLWFLRGDTDAGILQAKKVHIWDGNSTRDFLDSRGLHAMEEGDLGPIYGFQWRHFGADYQTKDNDYTKQGIDQLKYVENLIENNPNSRRIIMSAWNPTALNAMALPPCHVMCQFFVQDNYLSCQMYQRSADVFLGLPFNIASYALLTHILAERNGLKASKLVIVIGDAHIYNNHVDQVLEQITRNPKPFPTLEITRSPDEWDDYTINDFKVIDYNPMKSIKAPMNA